MTYNRTNDFFVQYITIKNIGTHRFKFFEKICAKKKTLHVGCADAMVFDPDSNLHIYLAKKVKRLHGVDTNKMYLDKLNEACPGTYFTNFKECDSKYDVIIVPEVLEHVWNAKEFLDSLFAIEHKEIIITVPNMGTGQLFMHDEYCVESVHPDHKYWFSPYTLYNIMTPYMMDHDVEMYYLEHKSQVCIRLSKKVQKKAKGKGK
jgi:hypothetical protein